MAAVAVDTQHHDRVAAVAGDIASRASRVGVTRGSAVAADQKVVVDD